jgi:hypothetical protein
MHTLQSSHCFLQTSPTHVQAVVAYTIYYNTVAWLLPMCSWTLKILARFGSHFAYKTVNQHFNYQLMHTTLKNIGLLKHSKISRTAPTCFGLQGNHHHGATVSTWLKITHLVKSRYVEAVQNVVSVMAAYCDCNKRIYVEYVK